MSHTDSASPINTIIIKIIVHTYLIKNIIPITVVILFLLEVIIIVASWIVSVLWQEYGFTPLISYRGIRWMVGELPEIVASHWLLTIILFGMTLGVSSAAFRKGISSSLPPSTSSKTSKYAERIAIHATIVVAVIFLSLLTYWIAGPGTLLLSATGTFLGSSLSKGIIPLSLFFCSLLSVTFGLFSGRIPNLSALFSSMVGGVEKTVPFLILYIFIALCISSVRFVIS